MSEVLSKIAKGISPRDKWERVILLGVLLTASFLAFYNLEYNPRTWHDEGAAMSVSKTLVQDGVYAVRSSEGYQTYGPIQSVGPTVLLPVALSFKVLGVGLIQGRIVAAAYMLLVLFAFYRLAHELFGLRTALAATALLIGSPGAHFLWLGRSVLGEMPALGLFLSGWLFYLRGVKTGRSRLCLMAGLLVGAAMVTKTQYAVIGFASLVLIVMLDLFFYRLGNVRLLMITALIAFVCVAVWQGWQWVYFGPDTFQQNAENLRQLADIATGFRPSMSLQAFKYIVGSDSGHFYYFWGFPALVYACIMSTRRSQVGFLIAYLLIFTLIWFAYYLFWVIPWPHIVYASVGITALFVGKLWNDLTEGYIVSWHALWTEISNGQPGRATLTLVVLIAICLLVCYPLQNNIQFWVLDRESSKQLQSPYQLADFLNNAVDKDSVIETWERELGILTDHTYHFPDQKFLNQTLVSAFKSFHAGDNQYYVLGPDYFQHVQPSYVIIGQFARLHGVYDTDYLSKHGCIVKAIGYGELRYDIYELHLGDGYECP